MLITRRYHFYAAHRAHTLTGDKCQSLHGHTYDVTVVLDFTKQDPISGVTMLFTDIDKHVEEIVIRQLDHATLLSNTDPLTKCLSDFNEQQAESSKMKLAVVPFPTTAENLSRWMFHALLTRFPRQMIEVRLSETKSGEVIYSLRDAQREHEERLKAEYAEAEKKRLAEEATIKEQKPDPVEEGVNEPEMVASDTPETEE